MATLIVSFRSPQAQPWSSGPTRWMGRQNSSPYPGAAHVFDFDQTRADARDASDRALSCIQNQLK